MDGEMFRFLKIYGEEDAPGEPSGDRMYRRSLSSPLFVLRDDPLQIKV